MRGKAKIKDSIKWEEPACDNCGSKNNRVFLDNITSWEHKETFREVKCENCGLVFLSPRPKKEYIGQFYSSKTYWGTDLTSNKKIDNNSKYNRSTYDRVYKNILFVKKRGSIFDVGSGTGLFLSYFNDLGWYVEGVDLSRQASKYAKHVYKLKNIKSESFDNMKVRRERYDVVAFNSSLEHLYSPKKALEKAYFMLKVNGILVITVPNLDSLGFRIFKKRWLGLHPPKHLYHFTTNSLSKILGINGFKIGKVDHWYWEHSYYSFFESFRYMMSPRFKINSTNKEKRSMTISLSNRRENTISLMVKKGGIIFAMLFSTVLSACGSLIRRGEVITIYAKKY